MTRSYPLEFVRGDTFEFTITPSGDVGAISAATMTVRKIDTDAVLFSVSGSVSGNVVTMTIPHSTTSSLAAGTYKYDVQLTISGNIYTPVYGMLNLIEDQTR